MRNDLGRIAAVGALAIGGSLGVTVPAGAGALPPGCIESAPPPDAPLDGQVVENTAFVHQLVEDVTSVVRAVGAGYDVSGPDLASVLAQLPPGTVLAAPSTTSTLTDITFTTEDDVAFACTDPTYILGSLADWPNLVVASGELTVTNTATTVETRHVTETTTYAILAVGAGEAVAPPPEPVVVSTNSFGLTG